MPGAIVDPQNQLIRKIVEERRFERRVKRAK
jgi:hypothetical protein